MACGMPIAALVTTSAAVGAVPKKVTVTGHVQAVSPISIKVAGTTCVFAPTNSRMMMPAIIRDIGVGDTAQLSCVRAGGRLVVASVVERPAGAVVVRGTVSATAQLDHDPRRDLHVQRQRLTEPADHGADDGSTARG